jgi:hypothetical protein
LLQIPEAIVEIVRGLEGGGIYGSVRNDFCKQREMQRNRKEVSLFLVEAI